MVHGRGGLLSGMSLGAALNMAPPSLNSQEKRPAKIPASAETVFIRAREYRSFFSPGPGGSGNGSAVRQRVLALRVGQVRMQEPDERPQRRRLAPPVGIVKVERLHGHRPPGEDLDERARVQQARKAGGCGQADAEATHPCRGHAPIRSSCDARSPTTVRVGGETWTASPLRRMAQGRTSPVLRSRAVPKVARSGHEQRLAPGRQLHGDHVARQHVAVAQPGVEPLFHHVHEPPFDLDLDRRVGCAEPDQDRGHGAVEGGAGHGEPAGGRTAARTGRPRPPWRGAARAGRPRAAHVLGSGVGQADAARRPPQQRRRAAPLKLSSSTTARNTGNPSKGSF